MENGKIKDDQTLNFSYDEILIKLEEMRALSVGRHYFTDEQDKVLLKARDEVPPVSFENLSELFVSVGWKKIGATTLKRRYKQLKEK